MTKKAINSPGTAKKVNKAQQSSEQLIAIRDLLFGEQVALLESSISQLQKTTNQRMSDIELLLADKTQQIESKIQSAVKEIGAAIEARHQEHALQENNLQEKLQSLSDALKEFQTRTQDELGETHQELDNAAKAIYQSLENEVSLLSQKIERTSRELSSNKADRKTLANLLESMASNLNESQA